MTKNHRLPAAILAVFASLLISGCASKPDNQRALYDLGPLRTTQAAGQPAAALKLPPISVAEVNMPSWLDSPLMYYRLNYANEQQPRPYATNRWIAPPGRLFVERLKARMANAGGTVLSASDGATGVRTLRIEADDFSQVFSAPGQSTGHIALRASVFNGRVLVSQKNFEQASPAPSADAEGGAKALAMASDAIIVQMITWLASLPAPQ
ncbi:MAG TPA: ABC-type transport auxiliary lipoprotein family protein [Noviherbaspirillum sp.]|jgi:cholesterol transport system auxiliary component|uniref:ABC-type transport auxiliary lipoprotein family protein n=1 Tax=Noviherbaspirillum sp. TaxID=1926288 RepID=UPI002DDDB0CE|nr:ABC-type transport auxiliary lipoprotein family protein [Noviherbaspirillum sp.]HEV2610249.1 ABC-type transport auxiliary lipoprotein family protein [Noviherbaspirillum sp.]